MRPSDSFSYHSFASEVVYVERDLQTRPIYTKRDTYTSKETYKHPKRPSDSFSYHSFASEIFYIERDLQKRPIYTKRDTYTSKETYKHPKRRQCTKRNMHKRQTNSFAYHRSASQVAAHIRDIHRKRPAKETHTHQKRPIYNKRDVLTLFHTTVSPRKLPARKLTPLIPPRYCFL